MPFFLGALERPLRHACDIFAMVGGAVLVAVACMTVVSVLGRAFWSHPILGDVELVQLGTAVVVACFLPCTQMQRGNILVDFFTANASASARRGMDMVGTLLYALVLSLICWRVAVGGVDIRATEESSMLMGLPLWIPYALMVPGLALSALIGWWQTLQALLSGPVGGGA